MWISIKILGEDVESAMDLTVRATNSHNINRIREFHLAGQCNMWTTLGCIFYFNATNHRDNIYATLGLTLRIWLGASVQIIGSQSNKSTCRLLEISLGKLKFYIYRP